jgi:hypothetical protein
LVAHSRLLSPHISYRTSYREEKAAGFDYLPARKKGVLTSRDRRGRKAFAQQCKKILSTKPGFFWRNIGFYSDGISSVYKAQPLSDALAPRGRVWRQFKTRVIKTLYNIYVDYFNNIITSMPTRMYFVLQAGGFRIKY